jgi:hypothetical protein
MASNRRTQQIALHDTLLTYEADLRHTPRTWAEIVQFITPHVGFAVRRDQVQRAFAARGWDKPKAPNGRMASQRKTFTALKEEYDILVKENERLRKRLFELGVVI